MKLTYDPKHNIAYMRLHEKKAQVETIRVSDELNELGYVEITKSQWDRLGLPKKDWEKEKSR